MFTSRLLAIGLVTAITSSTGFVLTASSQEKLTYEQAWKRCTAFARDSGGGGGDQNTKFLRGGMHEEVWSQHLTCYFYSNRLGKMAVVFPARRRLIIPRCCTAGNKGRFPKMAHPVCALGSRSNCRHSFLANMARELHCYAPPNGQGS